MAVIVLADDGLAFDGVTADERPLGGAETAFAALAAALAARGHAVAAFARGARRLTHQGVRWAPLEEGVADRADLYIANRGHRVLGLCPDARRVAFWIHNPAGYLLKWRYQWPLLRRRPLLVFSGRYHAGTYPAWAMGGERRIVPLGVSPAFLGWPERSPPAPVAAFTSNPLRGLDRLLELWSRQVLPRVPQARLRVFSGPSVYGDARLAARMAPVLAQARATQGVELHAPLAKPALAAALAEARVFVYGGDREETFCLAAAEAQAMGIPAVVGRAGSLPERIRHGETGFVAEGPEAFAAATVRLLSDDGLWQKQHRAALAGQAEGRWDKAAAAFEGLLGQSPIG